METLWNLYQERLDQLNDTFLQLLQEFEDNSLFTTPELSKYRVEYLSEIIERTLKNNQQKLILKLYQEIDQLKTNNFKLQQQVKQGAKKEYVFGQESQLNEKSLGSTKVSTVGNKKQGENDPSDIFLGGIRQKSSRKQTNRRGEVKSGYKLKQANIQREQKKLIKQKDQSDIQDVDMSEDDEISMMSSKFKYLRL